MTLSDYLRYEKHLTGTKVVCAEGDCGACTALVASPHDLKHGRLNFRSVNTCILPVLALDGCQVVTVEGVRGDDGSLHPVQKAMFENFGSQCGYCTPGFVCSMTALVEESKLCDRDITEKRAKNFLTGNLCRCTGYEPIVRAATSIDLGAIETLQARYHDSKKIAALRKQVKTAVAIETPTASGVRRAFLPSTLNEALQLKAKYPSMRIVAGATDLGVAVNKGRTQYDTVMSLQNVAELWKISETKFQTRIAARASLARVQKHFTEGHGEFDRLMNLFASPQIKNTGTLVGNIVNASPIADAIPFLLVSDAMIEAQCWTAGRASKRLIPIDRFYLGYKKLALKPKEIVTAILLPRAPSSKDSVSKLYKVSLRKDLDISAVTMAARFELHKKKLTTVRLAFGGVGPTVIRLKEVEKLWTGDALDLNKFIELSKTISNYVSPISDVRGSREYRLQLCRNLILKTADELRAEGVL